MKTKGGGKMIRKKIRTSFEVREDEWEAFEGECEKMGISRAALLRMFVRSVPKKRVVFREGILELIP